jgi:hypothetical protein
VNQTTDLVKIHKEPYPPIPMKLYTRYFESIELNTVRATRKKKPPPPLATRVAPAAAGPRSFSDHPPAPLPCSPLPPCSCGAGGGGATSTHGAEGARGPRDGDGGPRSAAVRRGEVRPARRVGGGVAAPVLSAERRWRRCWGGARSAQIWAQIGAHLGWASHLPLARWR